MKKLFTIIMSILVLALLTSAAFCADAPGYTEAGTAETLTEAVKGSGTVKLTADITLEEWLLIGYGDEIVLDLNGFVLSCGSTDPSFLYSVIRCDGKLTLTDSRPDAVHYFNDGTEADPAWVLTDSTEAPHSVTGGVITGGKRSGIIITRNGSLTVLGGCIAGNSNDSSASEIGGGIASESAEELRMTGGTVCGNFDYYAGGGIYCRSALKLEGGTVTQNRSRTRGGGVKCGTLEMSGGSITGNTVKNTSAIVTWGSAQNAGEAFGGGVYCGRLLMSGGEISGNSTSGSKTGGYGPEYGGGVCCTGNADLSGGVITQNVAGTGGGLCLGESGSSYSSVVTVGGSIRITGNTDSNGTPTNVYLNGQKFTAGTGAEGNGIPVPDLSSMRIGVSVRTTPTDSSPVQISTECAADYSGCFVCDRKDIKAKYFEDGRTLKLVPAYTISIPDKSILYKIEYNAYYDWFTASVYKPETGILVVIIAHYDEHGGLISCEVARPNLGARGASFSIKLSDHTKLFILNSYSPFCEPATVTAN